MKIKICGLRREQDIRYVNKYLPDYIGFVFAESSRQITGEQAAGLKNGLDRRIRAVGVYVDEEPDNIIAMLQADMIDIAQLHGKEEENVVQYIKNATGKPVWKAIKVREKEDVKKWLSSEADCLLFDNGQGTGRIFDWKLIGEVKRPFFLAGGIHAGNILAAACGVNPYGIDISSGAETDGYKEEAKIKAVIERAKTCRS